MNQAYINLQNILEKKYPTVAGTYVVSQSILDNVLAGSSFGRAMINYIGNIPPASQYNLNVGNLSIISAMKFLEKVIVNENKKENQFINFLMEKTGLTPPSSSNDWVTFVKNFQQQLDLGNLGIQRLENELTRLKSNELIEGKTIITKNEKEITIYIRERLDVLEYTKKALTRVAEYLTGKYNQVGEKIINYIYSKYGESLIEVFATNEGIDIKLNQGNTNGLILAISQLLIESFYTKEIQKATDTKNLKSLKYLANNFETTIKQFLQDDSRAEMQINNLLTRAKELPFFTRDLAALYKTNQNNTKTSNKVTLPQFDLSTEENTTKNIQNLRNYSKNNIDSKPTVQLIKNTSGLSEVSSNIRQIAAGAISGINTGSKGAKPDNTIAWLFIDYLNQNATEEMKEDLAAAQEAIAYEMQALRDTLKNVNTTDYYTQQKKNWNERIEVIELILNELKEKYNILANCFIIEDSTKHYTNMGVGEEKDFLGGSLGSNISDQIGKILALQDGGLITSADADWLITAAINCGSGLIGSHLKNSLEDYLAVFATILLFDDQQNIANEVANKMIEDIPNSQTSVNKIHLFSLDGGYYPLSVVLQLTYDKLVKIYGLEESELKTDGSHGAQVEINGFINPDDDYPPGTYNNLTLKSWDELSEKAKSSVKMKVKFVSNFMALLNTILSS
jgi:hypothetical protein